MPRFQDLVPALPALHKSPVLAWNAAWNPPVGNRGGDRAANNALYIVVLGRLHYDPRTRRYADRRTTEGLSKPEIIRCLKRYVAREIYNQLATHTTDDRPTTPPTMSRAA